MEPYQNPNSSPVSPDGEQPTPVWAGPIPQSGSVGSGPAPEAQPTTSLSTLLPGPIALLQAAWQRYRAHAGLLTAIYAFPIVLSYVLSLFMEQVPVDGPARLLSLVFGLVALLVSFLGMVALLSTIHYPQSHPYVFFGLP
ncbi:MAG: hypothetical protein COV10_04555 [Candidatus Vogelbacteria bacterium CG10_big_fil_rev_8_21_14_0_10_51_16]|uniref:Uncharacterized protein n=1 Tax=Candidatus Vogelbacteria bacterium CG10_big_fil_rev_8_21_14_0_10_51_16 TaxID=1975045 RepID=A0A2H0RDN7_9BACT|nr:MAG: hypothetical protein COV10_04555 [Candidatus Vogelbacteria bacterium CG10_big_fil_rev_8_21_14_0_10_51_16]